MMNRLQDLLIRTFNYLDEVWENHHTHYHISRVLVISFLLGLGFTELVQRGFIPSSVVGRTEINHFFAIEIAFTLLLLTELLAMFRNRSRSHLSAYRS